MQYSLKIKLKEVTPMLPTLTLELIEENGIVKVSATAYGLEQVIATIDGEQLKITVPSNSFGFTGY